MPEHIEINEQIEFLITIAKRLDSAGLNYMITGSMAMSLFAIPRMTRDIDIVLELSTKGMRKIIEIFEDDCFVDYIGIERALKHKSIFNIIHKTLLLKADFIIKKDDEYHRLEFERRTNLNVRGVQVSVVSPEDLVISKLWWARDSISEKQLGDVGNILMALPEADKVYISNWIDALELNEVWEKVHHNE